ncbi:MAG: 1-acyl-sn-glycerol-3-phosphate acyltransferase, partial [Kiritimatiellia bacterium]
MRVTPDHPIPRATRLLMLTVIPPAARLAGLRIRGAQHLPTRAERVIVACNHTAYVDSLWLHLACPVGLSVCGARARLYRSGGLRILLAVGE